MSVKFAGYTTAARPAGVDGQVIYDTDLSQLFIFGSLGCLFYDGCFAPPLSLNMFIIVVFGARLGSSYYFIISSFLHPLSLFEL